MIIAFSLYLGPLHKKLPKPNCIFSITQQSEQVIINQPSILVTLESRLKCNMHTGLVSSSDTSHTFLSCENTWHFIILSCKTNFSTYAMTSIILAVISYHPS